ncbi:receptor-like serine/threonine-protein kinase SD1-8 isoform X2 [Trifolium pratense]|uniref:receptor-like serine/threonine-protein kinase SD1-8 isoform X2 n=1 Tax=Trifolium pratense TaxID=57577 RepID=UPI001E69828C|nr:receptor-like serine/threonine-protein kinase SD1-8 isoform X2 [Trifolium pratense]
MQGFFFMFLFITSLSILITISTSTDTLTSSQILTTNQTLESSNETFVLGFIPGTNSNIYLAIWYKNIDPRTVVWVANRDHPLQNNSTNDGFLKIGDNGNIVLLNSSSNNNLVWSSNQTTVTKNQLVLQLLDNGNLVLRETNMNDPTKYLWQSFDYPTDTLLPSMSIGWNFDKNTEKHLTSWKITGEDPSTGDYSYKIDFHGLPEIYLLNGEKIIYRSRHWNDGISGSFEFSWNEHGINYQLLNENPSTFSRLVVSSDGVLEYLIYSQSTKTWTIYGDEPNNQCDHYKACGPYSFCDIDASPVCQCVEGFSPKNDQARKLRDGCTRKTNLDCESDEFYEMENVKLPDTTSVFVNNTMEIKECGNLCLRNCSCTAYSNVNISYKGGRGCVMWFGELVDIIKYRADGQELYIRRAYQKLAVDTNGKINVTAITIPTVIVATIIIAACTYFLWSLASKRSAGSGHTPQENQSASLIRDIKQVKIEDLPLFEFKNISTATNNFSSANKIGQGGFGSVYKGELPDGLEIAVKRLSRASGQGLEEFMNEVIVISKLQHRNLVRLLGCCIEGEEKMLVYEYMPNNSLDFYLFDPKKKKVLDWQKRLCIIEGISRGLLYLHRDSRLRIIHRDLKPSNILLDGELNPKISDFGMAKIFGSSENEGNTRRIMGTYGYMSPEYAMEGLFSEKSDVFSFGVLLLEIISGRKNTSFHNHEQALSLLGYAWKLWNEEEIVTLIDPEICNPDYVDDILRCIHIGLLCVQEIAKERPTMATVVLMLSSEIVKFPCPCQPAFIQRQIEHRGELPEQSENSNSTNGVTITSLQGR